MLSIILTNPNFPDLTIITCANKPLRMEFKPLIKLAVHIPFSVYLSQTIIASIANFSAMLVSVRRDGFGKSSEIWVVLIIIVVILVMIPVLVTKKI